MGSRWPRVRLGEPRTLTGRLAAPREAAPVRAGLSVHTAAKSRTMRTTREGHVLGQPERPGAASLRANVLSKSFDALRVALCNLPQTPK